jgi:endonuclease III
MDSQAWFILLSVFAGVAAIALCIQAGMLFAIFKSARATEEHIKRVIPQVETMLPKVEALVVSSTAAVDMSRKQIESITTKASDILDVTRVQLARIDGVLEDASSRVHTQLAHAEMVIDDTMSRAQETVSTVHSGIMKPLREIQGVAAGVRTAIFYLMRGGRPSPAQATADEEMFI